MCFNTKICLREVGVSSNTKLRHSHKYFSNVKSILKSFTDIKEFPAWRLCLGGLFLPQVLDQRPGNVRELGRVLLDI